MKGIILALCLLCVVVILQHRPAEASTQHYRVTGEFICGSRISNGSETAVKLLDKNFGKDTVMGKMKVTGKGTFLIDGVSSGLTKIDPELHIYTDCDDGKPCQRRVKLALPQSYIDAKKPYSIGIINLMSRFLKDEDRDCFH